jgi:hypothetical protein
VGPLTSPRAVLGGALLLLALRAGVATRSSSQPRGDGLQSRQEIRQPDPVVVELANETERLRQALSRVRQAPPPGVRNLFAVSDPPAAPCVAPPPEAPPLTPAVVEVAAPDLTLIGVAEDDERGTIDRTAILSGLGGDLFLVRQGDAIGARYRVERVQPDRADLVDVSSGKSFTLILR